LRHFLLVEHETHINELDNEDRYEKIYGRGLPPDEINELFKTWKQNRAKLLALANKVRATPIDSKDAVAVTDEWIRGFDSFASYVVPLNQSAGALAANRIKVWFETGVMPS
jgi:hypothetical protein